MEKKTNKAKLEIFKFLRKSVLCLVIFGYSLTIKLEVIKFFALPAEKCFLDGKEDQ